MTFQVLILVQILIIRFCGVAVTHYDENFLYFGTTFAFSVIVSAIILNYVLGFNVSGLELIINTIGLVCFLAMGSVSLSNFDRFYGDNNKNKFKYFSHIKEIKHFSESYPSLIALGVLAIITGLVFLVDLIWKIKTTDFQMSST